MNIRLKNIHLAGDESDPLLKSEQVDWAVQRLLDAAADRTDLDVASICICSPASDRIGEAAGLAGVSLPDAAESFALFTENDILFAYGADLRGLVHAITEIADRLRLAPGTLLDGLPAVEIATNQIRSICRAFASLEEDKVWFDDRQHWISYLDMLAECRFNRFSLALGLAYNYPYHNPGITDVYFHFPYPYLLDLPDYGISVKELSAQEREANLATLKFIGREAKRRGIDFQLALWTQRYDFESASRANYTVTGVTPANHASYCRDAVAKLLEEVPQITGLTFRIHVEGGIGEGDYAFWQTLFEGLAQVGRPVEIDLHGKGLDHATIALARASGMPVLVSPKYLGEHVGLPYHQASIREKEYPSANPRSDREKLSQGSRKFLRYSYGDLLAADRDWKVLFRVWPGTQRVLLWGDAEFARGYSRGAGFCGANGIEWFEPQSFKGRQGTGIPGQRLNYHRKPLLTRYDWEKYSYQYRIIGRSGFNPDTDPDGWRRILRAGCGKAAEDCEAALASASRILPLVTLAHGPSASNNYYWPEIYTNLPLAPGGGTRPYGRDMPGGSRFGEAPTFDPQLFCNPKEFAEALRQGETLSRFTPLDVAAWLEVEANACEEALLRLKSRPGFEAPAVQRIVIDAQIAAGLGRFFAEKFRASVALELYLLTLSPPLIQRAIARCTRAVIAWRTLASVARDAYPDDLTYGPQAWLRGSWQARLPEVENDLLALEALRIEEGYSQNGETAGTGDFAEMLERAELTRSAAWPGETPERFVRGQPLPIGMKTPEGTGNSAKATLHFRHVNQAERWQSIEMRRQEGRWEATIPADYTAAPFHLQYYVSVIGEGGSPLLLPGFSGGLAGQPYFVAVCTSGEEDRNRAASEPVSATGPDIPRGLALSPAAGG